MDFHFPLNTREGGAYLAKLKRETRIKRELERLRAIYRNLPDNKMVLALPLMENAAFMKITLEDLQESINASGCSEEYRNGKNQYGMKESADVQAYNRLIKNYNTISDRLEKMLPPNQEGGKLAALMSDD